MRLADAIPAGWRDVVADEFEQPDMYELAAFGAEERKSYTVYPPKADVFTALALTPYDDVRVVILGQDPYHGPNQAHGLAFSVNRSVPIPPSLRNMYQELKSDIKGFEAPKHGDLRGWAQQGVLLLNACLTVRANQAN